MKILYKAFFALTCVAAVIFADPQGKGKEGDGNEKGKGKKASPTERLNCKIVEPAPNTVWTMGEPQTVSWECEVDGPIEQVPPEHLIHIELGTGTGADDYKYVDTIDAVAKAREIKFTWVLLEKYEEGTNYIVRLRSKLKGDVDPVTPEEADKLPWVYSGPVTIIKEGTDPKSLPKAKTGENEEEAKGPKAPKGTDETGKGDNEPKGKGKDNVDEPPKSTDTADKGKATPSNASKSAELPPSIASSIELDNVLLFGFGIISSYFAL